MLTLILSEHANIVVCNYLDNEAVRGEERRGSGRWQLQQNFNNILIKS